MEWFRHLFDVISICQIQFRSLAVYRPGFWRMPRAPVRLNGGRGPPQPLVVLHASFKLSPREMFLRIPGRASQRFKESLRDQDGNIVDLEAEQPRRLFDIHSCRWRGEIQKIELGLIHGRFLFQFGDLNFRFTGKRCGWSG